MYWTRCYKSRKRCDASLTPEILPDPIYLAPGADVPGVIAFATQVLLDIKYCKKFLELPVVAKIDGEIVWLSRTTLPGLALILTLPETPDQKVRLGGLGPDILIAEVEIRCGPGNLLGVEIRAGSRQKNSEK